MEFHRLTIALESDIAGVGSQLGAGYPEPGTRRSALRRGTQSEARPHRVTSRHVTQAASASKVSPGSSPVGEKHSYKRTD